MASPFSIFRKNQKSFMVVLVIGSMIAFTGDSLFNQSGDNLALLGVLVGTGLALIAGFQFGRPLHYAVGGAIAGGLIGYFVPQVVGRGGIDSTLGAFDQKRVDELISRRRAANDFVAEVQRRSLGFVFQVPFGLTYEDDVKDVVLGEVLRAEAEEMGIYVDDAAVNTYIDENTGKMLKAEDFVSARERVTLNGAPISEKELYDLLRDEIQAQVALKSLLPFPPGSAATPEQYWQLYRQLNVRQQLVFAPVTVKSFLGAVGEPTDSDVADMFEKYRDRVPNQVEPGSPGFYQPRRIKVAYVEADYPTVEKTIAEITDKDIEEYYEKNKESFRKLTVPEDPEPPADPGLPADPSALPTLDGPEKKPADSGDEKTQPDAATDPGKASDDAAGKAASGAQNESGDGSEKSAQEGAGKTSEDDGGCEPWQDEKTEAASAAQSAAQSDAEKAAGQTTAPPADQTDSKTGNAALPGGTEPPEDFLNSPAPQYRPLEEVRLSIENSIRRERTQAAMETLIQGAIARMRELSEERDQRFLPGATGNEVSDNELCTKLKQYAESNGLLYAETPLATANEMLDREEIPIGSATQPMGNQFSRQSLNVVQMLFGGGDTTSLFEPARAELMAVDFGGNRNQFAYWAIAEIPQHEPKLDEPGVREQVVKAWKIEKARPLAEKRADALAAKVRAELSEEETMTEILEEETVTGSTDSATLIVTQSQPFSWLQTSTAASPMGQPQPARLSNIPGVIGADNDFMKSIFNELKPKEVGVVGNYDKSAYYVVQPLSRFPSDEFDEAATLERFLKASHFDRFAPMPDLVRRQFGEHNLKWRQQLEAKYGIDWGT